MSPAADPTRQTAVEALRGQNPGHPLDVPIRTFMETRFGHRFDAVRVHTDSAAAHAANLLHAEAFTTGQHIYFAQGRYRPETEDGRRLLAHELTHTIQQGGMDAAGAGHPMTSGVVGLRGDPLEREADAAAARVISDSSPAVHVSQTQTPSIQRYSLGEFENDVTGVATAAENRITGAVDAVIDTGSAIYHEATALAHALGAVVSISGATLVINVPAIAINSSIAIRTNLPEIGKDIPFLAGAIPVGGPVLIYGMLGFHVGFTPEISGQLGPCTVHGIRIVVDPIGGTFNADGAVTITTALGLGGEVRAGLHGEVGVTIVTPEGPISIPAASLEAGLAGFGRGTVSDTATLGGHLSYAHGSLSLSVSEVQHIGAAVDLGLAGYGALNVLGQNLCTLHWPLWQWHEQTVLSSSLGMDLHVGSSGASVGLQMGAAKGPPLAYSALPVALKRDMFTDDCPLCAFLYRLKAMPSQRGGAWHGPPRKWHGPALAQERSPAIASGSKCRGACGPDCDTCSKARDLYICETTPDGHTIWKYENYQECPTHDGCRQHDACYDWYAAGGETVFGLGHRLCDLQCFCTHNVPSCANWIGGRGGDGMLPFSDEPKNIGECEGPCSPGKDRDAAALRMCLPNIELFPSQRVHDGYTTNTEEVTVANFAIPVPYIGKVPVAIFVRGSLVATISGGLGPARLVNACLTLDPKTKRYSGSAELHLLADLAGSLQLTGVLGAVAGWRCLLEAVRIEGRLTGLARVTLNGDLSLAAAAGINCGGGKVNLDATVALKQCLGLSGSLSAGIAIKAFGFDLFDESWLLGAASWGRCWDMELAVKSLTLGGARAGKLGLPAAGGAAAGGAAASGPATGAAPLALPSNGAGHAIPLLSAHHPLDAAALVASLLGTAPHTTATPPVPADPAAVTHKTNPCATTPTATDPCKNIPAGVDVNLLLPPQKAIHLANYRSLVARRVLQHSLTRPERDTDQQSKWDTNVRSEMSIAARCLGISLGLSDEDILRPRWSANQMFASRMGVDHVIEYQVRPIAGGDFIDEPFNFEMLDASSNSSSGPRLSGNIGRERRRLAAATGDNTWLTRDLCFTSVNAEGGSQGSRWAFDPIVVGDHLPAFERLTGNTPDKPLQKHCEDRGGAR